MFIIKMFYWQMRWVRELVLPHHLGNGELTQWETLIYSRSKEISKHEGESISKWIWNRATLFLSEQKIMHLYCLARIHDRIFYTKNFDFVKLFDILVLIFDTEVKNCCPTGRQMCLECRCFHTNLWLLFWFQDFNEHLSFPDGEAFFFSREKRCQRKWWVCYRMQPELKVYRTDWFHWLEYLKTHGIVVLGHCGEVRSVPIRWRLFAVWWAQNLAFQHDIELICSIYFFLSVWWLKWNLANKFCESQLFFGTFRQS